MPVEENSIQINNNSHLLQKKVYQTKVFKRRWLILALYVAYAAINAFQWFEYSVITNIVMKYYEVTSVEVDWTSIIYVILYMPLMIPASYIIDTYTLRTTVLIGCLVTACGTIIKSLSFSGNTMWLIYLGQTLLSSVQAVILPLPPKIAMVWFGPQQVTLACCLGVFGTQLGQAVGLFVPPTIVRNHEDIEDIGRDLTVLTYILTGFVIVITISIVIYFPSAPPLPPSKGQGKEIASKKTDFFKSLKCLVHDCALMQHAVAYGINVAVFIGVSTLLNELLLMHFENSEEDAGRIGLLSVLAGMGGSVIFGFALDKTRKYKETTSTLYAVSAFAFTIFMMSLQVKSLVSAYISGIIFGFAVNTYSPVGLEMAIELVYPEPECTSSGILISMTQTFGAIYILLLGFILRKYGLLFALGISLVLLLIGLILTIRIPDRQKRQNALQLNLY